MDLGVFKEFREEIRHLPLSHGPIVPIVNDNVRYDLKVYRQKIYDEVDLLAKKEESQRKNSHTHVLKAKSVSQPKSKTPVNKSGSLASIKPKVKSPF